MFSRLELTVISIAYLLVLFGIAYYGDRFMGAYSRRSKPVIVGLCLATSFTAWTFYGASAQALEQGWYIPPTIVGTVGMIAFGVPLLKRLIRLGKQQRSTSIAGFLSSQYGNSRVVALLITAVTLLGLMPYLAIQLKAIAMSFDVLSGGVGSAAVSQDNTSIWADTPLAVALLMAAFSIIFGTRHVDLTEHHNGLMLAVAFECLVKLISLCAVGYFVGYQLFGGSIDLFQSALADPKIQQILTAQKVEGYGAGVVLGMVVFLSLPRFFHILVVESNSPEDANTAQWVFPLYATILAFFLLLIIIAGVVLLQGPANDSEMYFLSIPMAEGRAGLSLLAFIGGLSAATSMIIVSTITLSTMICNDMVVPLLLRQKSFYLQTSGVGSTLLNIRRVVIVIILLLAYAFYRLIGAYTNLGVMGLLSLSLMAQFSPTLLSALYWPGRHPKGAIAGIATGSVVWGYTLLLPAIVQAGWLSSDILNHGPLGIQWLRPETLFGFDQLDPLTNAVLWSLGLNTAVFVLVSVCCSKRDPALEDSGNHRLTNASLLDLATRFLGENQAKLALQRHYNRRDTGYAPLDLADSETVAFTESLLAGIIGPSSAKQIVQLTQSQQTDAPAATETLLEEASQVLKFSRELLQASIDNMNQGIAVIDTNQQLVVWNQQFVQMFDLPETLFYVGSPMEDLVRQSTRRETADEGAVERNIKDQLTRFSLAKAFVHHRELSNGRHIEVRGEPIPDKGYVITYTDITDYQRMVDALKESNETLEQRVEQRTEQLTQSNQQLAQAKTQAEAANQSKTRFLAAASHDLAQPLNAAKLFVTALQQQNLPDDPKDLVEHLADSLHNAESLIRDLFDIAKIDAGIVKKYTSNFPLDQVLDSLSKDFAVLAHEREIGFRSHSCGLTVHTDRKLLRRILQNLLSNALRYTPSGRVVIGCRRLKDAVRIEVWDTGVGIPKDDIKDIFTEFKRFSRPGQDEGMGLGLATVHRLCLLLELPIEVESKPGSGSVFRVTVPRASTLCVQSAATPQISQPQESAQTETLSVLCIDNDRAILKGMEAMVSNWGYQVICCTGLAQARQQLTQCPDAILADYHLDDQQNGIDAVQQLRADWQRDVPCVIISADQTDTVKARSKERGFLFQQKPIKPHALRAALSRFAAQGRHH
ncbi:hybrid sensor histidine kinase/response regulator [Pseudomaricurvus alkylphenolicus]|uniref:PAS domain-containing hybrid sensor histidine kinase/response regulator n=1 Tax=Pseudomaricurvus alkylphenolicus TaxID=1306991 RepID=UPI0014218CA9|nr:PAS domain-containing hybrid sensor histidine kinase/response regulator [Pseudomaricurvus alkylphenolicus]NIB38587.1 hybrid sensor histidine kinase/response regulator [Pseudomaricurvus alkylphenolicus]